MGFWETVCLCEPSSPIMYMGTNNSEFERRNKNLIIILIKQFRNFFVRIRDENILTHPLKQSREE